jgi:hypothetical protein
MNVFDRQVGGEHYKCLPVQPLWFIRTNGFGYIVGNIIKYACRYWVLGNEEDLEKIIQYAEVEIKEKGATYEIRSEKEMLDDVKSSHPTGGSGQQRDVPVRDLRSKEAVERDAGRASSERENERSPV